MIKVIVKSHFYKAQEFPLSHITKNWIVVRWNEKATRKFSRLDGYESGAFRDRMSLTPSKVLNLEELNRLADGHGGVYKPK